MYYKGLPVKRHHCVRGNALLYAYCNEKGIAHRNCGKLIVATDAAQLPALHALYDAATRHGDVPLRLVEQAEARCVADLAFSLVVVLIGRMSCNAGSWSPK